MKESMNVYSFNIYLNWNLLTDEDDNKFIDCYVTANADYLITNDADFNKVKKLVFLQLILLR